ncbi:unnamed protein product [Arctia plantaginis]|uniref:Uncharacterized protein n=1 Tax=Arctia plantaginis TaxID=874455 RepID=A0A8S1AM60_ARCPL|nr:unnamed protein product [Arctia plantaginis]
MFKKICLVFLAAMFIGSEGVQVLPTNYDLSRNSYGKQLGGGNYGQQPGYYPGGGYGGGYYPGHQGPAGPPGAHPGCPLCDSSVYSYCSYKQAHDSCCCDDDYNSFTCSKTNCNFLYANSCQELQLITNCCCVDLLKSAGQIKATDVI